MWGNTAKRRRFWVIAVMLSLVLSGIALCAGSSWFLSKTSTTEFCISCHEMRDNNYEEYRQTIHATNRTGVKAGCPDCHVPHELGPLIKRKIFAVSDIYHHLVGTIDTREKFLARRQQLAAEVWRQMKETDSRECRSCHDVKAMSSEKQGLTAQKQHRKLLADERTCIDCHYGIAHKEPPDLVPDDVVAKPDS